MLTQVRMFAALTAFVTLMAAFPALAQRSTPVQLLHPAGAANDTFGYAVAIDGDTMIVGAPEDDVGANSNQGSAHIYRWTGSGWTFEATLTAAGGAVDDYFGYAVALSGNTALVGAFFDNVGANVDQGSVHVFVRSGTTWTLQAQLTASDGAANDLFGTTVAISGNTALVGASSDDVGATIDQGSAYVFTRSGTTWTEQAQLTASSGAAFDRFGNSVALSGDTALVGASQDDVGANSNQGSAYVFTRSGTTWTQQAQLTATGGAASDFFGGSVALSGDTALVGAFGDDVGANLDQGSASVFTRSGTTWTQQAQLTASDGAASDLFGGSVALAGNTALVGAYRDDVGANTDQGSASVFTRSGTTWTQQAHLTAPGGAASDFFGISVALSGDTALVGAHLDDVSANTNQGSAWVLSRIGSKWIGPDLQLLATSGAANDNFGISVALSGDTALVGAYSDDVGANFDQGSAYVFVRSGAIWIQQAQLTASDGAAGVFFGYSVALSGDTALIGVPFDTVGVNFDQGSAYVFTRSGTTWTQQAKLTNFIGAEADLFGISVALSGNTALVGAYGSNGNQGAACVFTRSGTTWIQQAQLTASGGAVSDFFGISVALSGDTALMGAPGDNVGANADQGSAYVFTRSGTTWTQQAQLTASDGAAGDGFGTSVALSGDTALVGASGDDVAAANQGSAFVFTRSGTTWTQQAQLTASDRGAGDRFGISVALAGDTALVGAHNDDVGANADQGSAYIFTRSGTTWTQQAKLTASGGAASDVFGSCVALSGDTALVGAYSDDVAAANQGSAWTFDIAFNDLSLAHNDVTAISYPTLAAALLPAVNGQQIMATEAAWRTAAALNTTGRRLSLQSFGDLRTPSTSALTLDGSSTLGAPAGSVVEIFGALSVPANQLALVSSDSVRLGSRGSLRLFSNASLWVDTPTARLDAPVQLDSRASLDLRGNADTFADLTAAAFADVSASGTLTNHGAWSITSASVSSPTFNNRGTLGVDSTSGIFGDFVNEAGAVTTITSGWLFVVGSLTNNGTITGAACSNCFGPPPNLDVDGTLTLGTAATLIMPFNGSDVRVTGSFDCAINANTRYDLSLAMLQLEGTSGGATEQTLEAMSVDIGADAAGLDRTLAGHFPIGTLHIGPSASTVRVVDARDNDGNGQAGAEAVYVRSLQIGAGSRLINPTTIVYYETLDNQGALDHPSNVIQIGTPPCLSDYTDDGIVDILDFLDFMDDFGSCENLPAPCGNLGDPDLNADTVIDVLDFLDFIDAFGSGC